MSRLLFAVYRYSTAFKHRLNRKFSSTGQILLAFMLLTALFGLNTRLTMMYQLSAIVLALLLLAIPFSLTFGAEISIRREISSTCTAGQQLFYRLLIQNDGKKTISGLIFSEQPDYQYPSYSDFLLLIEDREDERGFFERKFGYYRWLRLMNQQTGGKFGEQQVPTVQAKEQIAMEVFIQPLRRGYIQLSGYSLSCLDPFGLLKSERRILAPQKILVLPKLYPVEWQELAGSRKYHQGGLSSAANVGESGEFVSLREYRQGDPVKHIDWKATARLSSPIVRQYQDEYYSRYGIILDSFNPPSALHFEDAVSIAASIIVKHDAGKSPIDLLFASSNCISSLSMGQGDSGQQQILEILACMTPCQNKKFEDLAKLVITHRALLSGVIMVLLTIDTERVQLINYLASCNIPCSVILISTNEGESKQHLHELNLYNVALFNINSPSKVVRLS